MKDLTVCSLGHIFYHIKGDIDSLCVFFGGDRFLLVDERRHKNTSWFDFVQNMAKITPSIL